MAGVLGLIALGVVAGSLFVIYFISTRKIVFPRIALTIVSMLEIPIKNFLAFAKINTRVINDMDVVDLLIAKIRNLLFEKSYTAVPYTKRIMLMPQCLRSPECPARLGEEGLQCINCGRCQIGELKKEAEGLGYKFFVIPGGSFVRRLIKKYKPEAVLGVGCHMEIKEGTELVARYGLPVQAVPLTKDGCFKTEADFDEIRRVMLMRDDK